jgi:hypothetical protein
MPPRRRFYEPEDFEPVDPPEYEEIQEDFGSEDREVISLNLNSDYYRAQLKRLTDRVKPVHAQLQKILADFNDPDQRFPSKKEKIQYFASKIKKEEKRLAQMEAEIEKELDELWFYHNENPFKIPGTLFNAQLANELDHFRRKLDSIFDELAGARFSVDRELADSHMLLDICNRLVRPSQKPMVTSSGLFMPTEKMVALTHKDDGSDDQEEMETEN